MKRLVFVLLSLFVAPAYAEDVSVRTLCQMLPQHVPDASVNYQPGVSANGKYVVPADVNKILGNNFDAVDIPVAINLLQSLNINAPAGAEIEPTVAVLKVYGDGRVKYNGQDVTQQAQQLCTLRTPATVQPNSHVVPSSSFVQPQAAVQSPVSNPASLNAVAPAAGGAQPEPQQEPRQEPLGKLPLPPPFEPVNARGRDQN